MKKKIFIIFFILCISLLGYLKLQPKKVDQSLIDCRDCNIILITMTNLRFDHMSANGYSRLTTPNLDTFGKESLIFDNAFSHSSWTLPESISIYTGLYPYQHGIMNRYDGSTLSSAIPTLIDVLNKNGYKTAAFTGGFDYNPKFGLTDRFSEYQECTKGAQQPSLSGQNVPMVSVGPSQYGEFNCSIPKATEWLKANYQSKFFLHVQGYDAHCPFSQKGGYTFDKNYKGNIDYSSCLWTFDKSEPIMQNGELKYPVYSSNTGTSKSILLGKEDISHLVALYDESIVSADKQIGDFLGTIKDLGLNDKTIIMFTSEHGDMFGKNGRFMRGGPLRGTFYDDVIHVPLMIRNPKIAPKRLDGLVEHIDLAPTLLDFLGLNLPSPIAGKSLIPLIFQNKEINFYVFAGSEFSPAQDNPYYFKRTKVDAVRNKQWKLIKETIFDKTNPSQTVELYDIINDKEELHNLADSKKQILSGMLEKLTDWSGKFGK